MMGVSKKAALPFPCLRVRMGFGEKHKIETICTLTLPTLILQAFSFGWMYVLQTDRHTDCQCENIIPHH